MDCLDSIMRIDSNREWFDSAVVIYYYLMLMQSFDHPGDVANSIWSSSKAIFTMYLETEYSLVIIAIASAADSVENSINCSNSLEIIN